MADSNGSAALVEVHPPSLELPAAPVAGFKLHRRYLGERTYGVRYSGRVVELLTKWDPDHRIAQEGGGREAVGSFSSKSRARLLKLTASIPWEIFGVRVFATLTYPGEFSTDGRVCKAHLRAFRARFERRYGRQAVVWKLEFQRRDAPHFHFIAGFPSGVDLDGFRQWLSSAWYEIVGSGDLRHLVAGTSAEVAETDCGKYFAYGVKSTGSKEFQNQVPEGFENVGRFWGAWNIKPEWKGTQISEGDFFELRRRVSAWNRSMGRKSPRRSRVQGGWQLTEGKSAAMVLARLSRGLVTVEGVTG